eukprot:8952482-Lingulodinium_polyedra.AAC.1
MAWMVPLRMFRGAQSPSLAQRAHSSWKFQSRAGCWPTLPGGRSTPSTPMWTSTPFRAALPLSA